MLSRTLHGLSAAYCWLLIVGYLILTNLSDLFTNPRDPALLNVLLRVVPFSDKSWAAVETSTLRSESGKDYNFTEMILKE